MEAFADFWSINYKLKIIHMKHFLILLRGALLPNRCLLGVLLAFLMVGCTEKRSEGQEEITSIVIDWDNISDNLDYFLRGWKTVYWWYL